MTRTGSPPDELDLTRGEPDTSPSGTASTSASVPRWPEWKERSRSASLLARYPRLRLAVPPAELHWRNRLVLRSLKALPVSLGTSRRSGP